MSKYDRIMEVLEENFLGASINNVTDEDIIEILQENGLACTIKGSKYYSTLDEYEVEIEEAGAYIVFSFYGDECIDIYWL